MDDRAEKLRAAFLPAVRRITSMALAHHAAWHWTIPAPLLEFRGGIGDPGTIHCGICGEKVADIVTDPTPPPRKAGVR